MEYKVLVVDDEPWSRQLVISLIDWQKLNLSLAGEAEDASQGIAMIEELNPPIVVTDMRMPGMDGADFLKEMERRYPHIKVIVLSGYDDFAYLQQALRSGAADYLLKPVDRDQLNETLEKCISELNKETVSGQTMIFSDTAILDNYIEYRNRIFSFLLELDYKAVEVSLNQLRKYLSGEENVTLDRDTLFRIYHDFIVMLEEFATRIGLDSRSLESLNENAGFLTGDEIFPSIIVKYEKTILKISEYQSRKGSLDLSEVKDHLDRYYREQISLESVSKLFLVSKEHMSRAFKKSYDITLNDYIIRLRMEKARSLIADEGVEIKEVAYLCGYTDLPYFYRVFKKHFGIPPGKLRSDSEPGQ